MPPDRSVKGRECLELKDSIQVAGIQDEDEARMLLACGVDYLGFPLGVPIHRENVTEKTAARIIRTVEIRDRAVLITYLEKAGDVIELCRKVGANIVQLHGRFDSGELQLLRKRDSSLRVIKCIAVGTQDRGEITSEVDAFADLVDAFIVDTFDESTGARGATGKTHDWRASRAVVESSPRPVILAGGLSPANVRSAIVAVKPAAVDVHTGVEDSTGGKSRDLVRAFVAEARDAFSRLASGGHHSVT